MLQVYIAGVAYSSGERETDETVLQLTAKLASVQSIIGHSSCCGQRFNEYNSHSAFCINGTRENAVRIKQTVAADVDMT